MMQSEASTNGDDDTSSSTSVQIVVPEQIVNGLRSDSKTSVQKDCTEKYRCLNCNRGGKLLTCSESECPISLHEECMKWPARFDGIENFLCPYCWYKRVATEECEAKKKVMMMKYAVSIFLNEEMVDGNQEKQYRDRARGNGGDGTLVGNEEMTNQSETVELNDEMVDGNQEKQNGDNARGNGGDGPCFRDEEIANQSENVEQPPSLEAENGMQVDDIQQGKGAEDKKEAKHACVSPIQEDIMLGSAAHISKEKNESHIFKEDDGSRAAEVRIQEKEQQKNMETVSVTPRNAEGKDKSESKPLKGELRKSPRISSQQGTNEVQNKNATPSSTLGQLEEPSTRKRQLFPEVAYRKVPWTGEEEKTLKEGVEKFSNRPNKNIPWRKILESGRHVFNQCRSPADLKDKWRRIILAKERSTK